MMETKEVIKKHLVVLLELKEHIEDEIDEKQSFLVDIEAGIKEARGWLEKEK